MKQLRHFQGISEDFTCKKGIYFSIMATSSSVLKFIANPTVVENVKHPRPIFKIIPKIAKQDDSIGAFSKISKRVYFSEDPRIYIH